jgi:ribosome maturation factor RimP
MSTALDRVRAVVEPLADEAGVELFDLELAGGVLRVTIDKQPGGVDLTDLTAVTRAVSRALDDADPITGRYTLEVSSPGLERTLRTRAHYAWAVGRDVAIKTVPTHEGERRLSGRLVASTDAGLTVVLDGAAGEPIELAYDDIEAARTVLHWGPSAKPGTGSKPGKGTKPPKAPKAARTTEPGGGAEPAAPGRRGADDDAPPPRAGAADRIDRNEEKANAS